MKTSFIPSTISFTPELLHLLEQIARKQGELLAFHGNIEAQMEIESVAMIDAVHFSTKIEGNTLTRDQVTQALNTKKNRKTTRDLNEVLNYSRVRKSLRTWSNKNRELNESWVLSHHHELLTGLVSPKLRGHYRQAQCVIQDTKTSAIVYMAADFKDVPQLMKGLLAWLKMQKIQKTSALLLAAQFHFEFVTIHPFMDGNGRLARLLTNAILWDAGYDVERFAALEKQHEKNRGSYYSSLRALQAHNYYDIPHGQDISSWIIYWLQCLLATYDEALIRVTAIKPNDHSENRIEKALTLFTRHKKLKASEYSELMGLARTQAVADLNQLTKKKLIKKVGGGRSTVYQIVQRQQPKE